MTGPESSIRIVVRCFSHVRDALGAETLSLELPAGATAADGERLVRAMAPARLEGLPLRLAVNRAFSPPGTPLQDGDELALLPPVQGG